MRTFIVIIACLSIILLGAFGTAAILLDEDRVKSLVARHVENHTGHRVEILGTLKLRFFPGLKLSAERVVLSRPGVVDGPSLFTSDRMEMQVRLLPLIRGRVDATEVRMGGARINLDRALADSGLKADRTSESIDSGARQFSGPIFLDGVIVSTSDGAQLGNRREQETFEIEQVILKGFAFGQPLEFAFRGNIGEPGLFDEVEIDGLMVFSQADRMRLSNLRMRGSMDDGMFEISLLGNATFSVHPHLEFSIDSGRLKVNDQTFELDMAYRGTERSYFSLDLVTELLDVEVADILGFMAALPYEPEDSGWLTTLRGTDFDVSLMAEQIARQGMVLNDVTFSMSGDGGAVLVESMRAGIPAGFVSGKGALDLRRPDPRWKIELEWEVASLARSLDAMQLDWNLDGAGIMALDLQSASPDGDPGPLPWTGTGYIELWDGYWPVLGELAPRSSAFSSIQGFDYLHSALTFGPAQMAFYGLQLVSDGVVIEGDVRVSLPEQNLAGRVHVTGENGESAALRVSGTTNQPAITRIPFESLHSQPQFQFQSQSQSGRPSPSP